MKRLLLALALLLPLAALHAQTNPAAPSADAVREWAGFPADFVLKALPTSAAEIKQNVALWGQPVWMWRYENPDATLVSYTVGLFAPGTLWGSKRAMLTNNAQIQNTQGGTEGHIEYRPDGRQVYFTVLGTNMSGSMTVAFTFLPLGDLLVVQNIAAPSPAHPIAAPVAPAKHLSQIFMRVEGAMLAK